MLNTAAEVLIPAYLGVGLLWFFRYQRSIPAELPKFFIASLQLIFAWPFLKVLRERVKVPAHCDRCGSDRLRPELAERGWIRLICPCGRIQLHKPGE